MILFEKKYRRYSLGGILGGGIVGGTLHLITGYPSFLILFWIIGILLGIIEAQKQKLKEWEEKEQRRFK